jgi:hypothetical protein
MLSALLPATKMRALAVGSGRMSFAFLEQNQRLLHGLAGQRAMLGAAHGRGVGAVGERPLEQPQFELLGQDPPVGVVDARHRDPAGLHLGAQQGDEARPRVGHHHHVDARVDRGPDLGGGEAGLAVDLVDAVPVGDHEPVEPQLSLEDGRDEVLVAVQLLGHRRADAAHQVRVARGPEPDVVREDRGPDASSTGQYGPDWDTCQYSS